MSALNANFPPNKVKIKPGPGGRKLKFISHGLVTERLNEAAPGWTSEITQTHTYTDQQGKLHCAGVQIRLCLYRDGFEEGVSLVCREEAGGPSRVEDFANEVKNACSDALKRAAMRFGVALSMWEDMIDSVGDDDYDAPPSSGPYGKTPPRQPNQEPTPIKPNEDRLTKDQATWFLQDFNEREISDEDRMILLQRLFGKSKLGLLTQQEGTELQTILVDDEPEMLRQRIEEARHLNLA